MNFCKASLIPDRPHIQKCNVCLPCVKHALNVQQMYVIERTLNAWIEHHTFNVYFLPLPLYMRFEKHAFNAWYEKHAFYHPLDSIMLTYYNPSIKTVFKDTYV